MRKIVILSFFLLSGIMLFANRTDSFSLVDDLKRYYISIDPRIDMNLYTRWVKGDKPLIYLFVSRRDSVQCSGRNNYFDFYDTAEFAARRKAAEYSQQGSDTFCYRTYGNAQAFLSRRLLSYPDEAIAFVVFHELTHNFFLRNGIRLAYGFEEAICDVIGNYGALEYAVKTSCVDRTMITIQIQVNESIYEHMNRSMLQVSLDPQSAGDVHSGYRLFLDSIMPGCNMFQEDRFNYPVNNAYFLKNRNYSQFYFLVRDLYLKQASLGAFLEVIKKLPQDSNACETYLKSLLE
jgi:predicted aminopeptidase